MLDALNLYSGPDNEGLSEGVKNDSGDGVLKTSGVTRRFRYTLEKSFQVIAGL